MQSFNIHEAKTHFSKLLDRVLAGDEIVIARHGKPIAKLVPMDVASEPRRPGALKGNIWISDDFDAHNEEITALFNSEE